MIITHPHFNLIGLCDEYSYSWNSILHNNGHKGPRYKNTIFLEDLIKRR